MCIWSSMGMTNLLLELNPFIFLILQNFDHIRSITTFDQLSQFQAIKLLPGLPQLDWPLMRIYVFLKLLRVITKNQPQV